MNFERALAITNKFASEFPDELSEEMESVDFLVCETPADATRELNARLEEPLDEPIPGDTKGVFIGEPMEIEESDESEEEEAVRFADGFIVIITANCANDEEVQMTLLHETGHALGYDEQEVAELGLSIQQKAETDGVNAASS